MKEVVQLIVEESHDGTPCLNQVAGANFIALYTSTVASLNVLQARLIAQLNRSHPKKTARFLVIYGSKVE